MAILNITVFTCDRDSGNDNGYASESSAIDEHSHEAHFKALIGNMVMAVVNRARASHGMDARQYDINVRFENAEEKAHG